MSYDKISHRTIPDDSAFSPHLSYQQFKSEVVFLFKEKYEPSGEVIVKEVPKNNGTKRDGLYVHFSNSNISPTFYLEDYYTYYCENGLNETLDYLLEQQENYRVDNPINTDFISDYEFMKKHLSIRLINADRNQEILKKVPWLPLEDLALICSCVIKDEAFPGLGSGTMIIYKDLLEDWNITEKQLFHDAIEAAPLNCVFSWCSLDSAIKKMYEELKQNEKGRGEVPVLPIEEDFSNTPEIYILGNEMNRYGASVICYPHVLDLFARKFDDDVLILPSSIHEVLVTGKEWVGSFDINQMIREVNQTEVSENEILSDHAYLYLKEEKKIVSYPY